MATTFCQCRCCGRDDSASLRVEGFATLQIDNNLIKWQAMFDLEIEKRKAGKKGIKICKSKDVPGSLPEEPINICICTDKNTKFSTKHTQANSGQCKLQGMSEEGLKQHKCYCGLVKKGRKEATCPLIEKKVFDKVRNLAGIKWDSYEEHQLNHKKKKQSVVEEPPEVDGLFFDSEDDKPAADCVIFPLGVWLYYKKHIEITNLYWEAFDPSLLTAACSGVNLRKLFSSFSSAERGCK